MCIVSEDVKLEKGKNFTTLPFLHVKLIKVCFLITDIKIRLEVLWYN